MRREAFEQIRTQSYRITTFLNAPGSLGRGKNLDKISLTRMRKLRQNDFCIFPQMELSLSEDKLISPPEENVAVRSGRYLWLLLFVPFFSTASFAQSDRYNVIQLETRPEVSSMVRGLNNSALVVGRFGTEFNTGTRGFIWNGGNQMQQLGSLPSGDFSEAVSINELGDVVGSSNSKAHLRALLWSRQGEMRDLGTRPATREGGPSLSPCV